jgi:hypothetical protein
MDYLQAWQDGYKVGRAIQLELINTHCNMQFDSLTDVIIYIREVAFANDVEQEHVQD